MTFREFLLLERGETAGKTGLYPLGYGGIGLYPPQDFITKSADAFYYMSKDDRLYTGNEKAIKHVGGKPSFPPTKDPSNHDDAPHSIKHLPGQPSASQGWDYALKDGDGPPFKITHIKKNS
jgi:hypothetical protein